MAKNKLKYLKYRWVVLLALVVWLATTLAIAAGTARRPGVTVTFAFVPLLMILVALAPASVPRITTHKWCIPIMSIWGGSTLVAITFVSTWLLGYGQKCTRVAVIASVGMLGTLNVCWIIGKLYRWAVAHARHKPPNSIQEEIVKPVS